MDIEAYIKQMLKVVGLEPSNENVQKVKDLSEEDETKVADAIGSLIKDSDPNAMDAATFEKWLETHGVKDVFNRRLQSEADKRLTNKLKELEKTKKTEKKEEPKKENTDDDPITAKLNALVEANKTLSETVTKLVNKNAEDERISQVESLLKENELPPSAAEFITGKEPDEIKRQIDVLKGLGIKAEERKTEEDLKALGSSFGAGKKTSRESGISKTDIKKAAEQQNASRKGETYRDSQIIPKKLNLSDS